MCWMNVFYGKQFTRMWLDDRIGECKILIRKAFGWSLSFCVPQIVWVTIGPVLSKRAFVTMKKTNQFLVDGFILIHTKAGFHAKFNDARSVSFRGTRLN